MADKSPRLGERKRIPPSSPRQGARRKGGKSDDGISLMPPGHMDYGAFDDFNADIERRLYVRRGDVRVARQKLILAAIVCFIFTAGEIIGGYMSNSLAIFTDAAHMLTDLITILISLFALWMSERSPSKSMTFGWYRLEVIFTLLSILCIWILTGILVYFGIERVRLQKYDVQSDIMLITAACGVAVNFLISLLLHTYCPAHAQMCLTSTRDRAQLNAVADIYSGFYDEDGGNRRTAMVHVIGDMIQSSVVLVAAIIIYINPDLGILDPICTFLFAILVLITTVGISFDIMKVLMAASPRNLDYTNIRRTLVEIDGVESIHSLHIWSLTIGVNAIAVHLTLANLYEGKPVDGQDILSRAQKLLKSRFNLHVATIQVETYEARDWCSYRSDVYDVDS
ncbi:proton-coupled zinc antiporter SLC30A2-like [Antedon mediterranea]|uniref:proton-coupled zinc antiporter SLC30A2-like n=1 Tax=Antedon mediterranea TaxID=105859 RepID=UPI003AF5C1E3